MKRAVALVAAIILLAGLPFAQTMGYNKKVATVTGGVRWSRCAFGPEGVLHIVFEEDTSRGHPIWYVNYDGTTVSTPFNVTGSLDVRGERPGIAVGPRGQIAVVWGVDVGDIVYARLYDPKTKTWGAVETVSAGYGWDEPSPAIDANGTVHVAYFSMSGGRAYCSSKINDKWEAPSSLSGSSAKDTTVAVGHDNKAWSLWREKGAGGSYKNYYATRTSGGSWTGGTLVTSSGGSSSHPSITVGPNNIPVATWGDIDPNNENGAEIRMIRLGTGEAREIVINKYMQHYPVAAVDTNLFIHIATQLGGGDFGSGAFYANNTKGSWAEPQTLVCSMDKVVGLSADPYGNVGLCMSDMTSTGSDIYVWTTQPIIPRYIYPPTNLAATVKSKNIRKSPEIAYNLSWTANSANPDAWVAGYDIYVKEGSGNYTLLLSVNKSTLNASFTYTDASVKRYFGIVTTNPGGGESELAEF